MITPGWWEGPHKIINLQKEPMEVSLFFDKVGGLRSATLLKETLAQAFRFEF